MARKTQVVNVQIQGQIFWIAHRDPATGRWLGVCPPLNLNAVGDTFAELQVCASDAMALLFLDLFESGELQTFLMKNGWQAIGLPGTGAAPRFDVPADWKTSSRFEELMAVRA